MSAVQEAHDALARAEQELLRAEENRAAAKDALDGALRERGWRSIPVVGNTGLWEHADSPARSFSTAEAVEREA